MADSEFNLDIRQRAAARIAKYTELLKKRYYDAEILRREFEPVARLVEHAPHACIPIVDHVASCIEHGGRAWSKSKGMAQVLVEKAPELYGEMRVKWSDPLLFQVFSGNADSFTQELAKALDLASSARGDGALGLARAMMQSGCSKAPRPLFIIGAGFSYDSMPLTQELEALVTGLLAGRGITDPVQLLRDDWKSAWRHIANDCDTFKQRFIGFSATRNPAIQHTVLGRALVAHAVAGVVSFNWDNHLERAAPGLTVVNNETQPIRGPGLWKMHGDVNAPGDEWVWPYQDGRPLKNVCEYVLEQATDGRISHVVVVGYGEREVNVTEMLLKPLAKACPNWMRVRPAGQEGPQTPDHVAKSARQFLGELDSFQRAISQGLV